MKNIFQNRTAGFYTEMISALLGALTGIILIVYSNAVDDFYIVPPCIMIAGAVISAVAVLARKGWMMILPGCCYISSLAIYLSSQLDNISGRISNNGIGVTGTTMAAMFVFFGMMLAATLLAVTASFMKQSTEE